MGSYHGASGPCHRCGRGGHLARDCSLHTCFRCNGRGHMAWECVEGVTCSRCGEKGHLQRNCKNVSCHKCGRKGHISKFCNDPFIKAEEIEKHERQLALFQARSISGSSLVCTGKGSSLSLAAGASNAITRQKGPGPWDGLGERRGSRNSDKPDIKSTTDTRSFVHRQGLDRLGQDVGGSGTKTPSELMNAGKLGPSSSEVVFLDKVKTLTVKRKNCHQAHMGMSKRSAIQSCSQAEADLRRESASSECKTLISDDEPVKWNGLVGYGSEDSSESSYSSSDVNSEVNCNLVRRAQSELRSSQQDGEGYSSRSSLLCSEKDIKKESFLLSSEIGKDSGNRLIA